MKRPLPLTALFATLVLAVPAVATTGRPNIIFILTDDLGWGVTKIDELTVIPSTESTAHP